MALFQPTFVIPSTRTEGTVDVNDNMEVKWQVNGQSAMIAFKIDFFRNDWASTPVTTTGRQPVDGGGFRGIDRFGKVKFYTYAPNTIWKNNGFINGMQYKMQITQYYIDNPNEYYVRTGAVIDKETDCYFGMPNPANPSQVDYYLSFTLPEAKYPMGTKISYNISSENGFVIKNNALEFLTMTKSTTKPTEGTDLGIATNEESVVQRSMDVFRTFTKPTMALYKTPNEDFIWQDGVGEELLNPRNLSITTTMDLGAGTNNYFSFIQNGTQTYYASFTATNAISANTIIFYNAETKQGYYELNGEQVNLTIIESTTQPTAANNIGKAYIDLATSIGYFHTNYMQDQGKPIRWVEWQVATANNGVVGDIIADTGKINTQTLDYSYNGFFNGQQYAIRCYGYSESEQYCDTGWIIFNVNIKAQGEYTGNFNVQCLPKENATLLQWEGVEVIPPRVSPEGYKPLIANGSVTLAPKNPETGEEYSVTWDKQLIYDKDSRETKTIPMNFEEPWTAVWKGDAQMDANIRELLSIPANISTPEITSFDISPNGRLLVCGTTQKFYVYKINADKSVKLLQTYTYEVYGIKFSIDGKLLVITSPNGTYIYLVTDEGLQYSQRLEANNIKVGGTYLEFSPNGKILIVGGGRKNNSSWTGLKVLAFAVNNLTITFIKEITKNNMTIEKSSQAYFSIDSQKLLIINETNDSKLQYASVFDVGDNNFQFVKNLTYTKDNFGISACASFSPNGKLLAILGYGNVNSDVRLWIYSIDNNDFTYEYNLQTKYTDTPQQILFSPDGYNCIILTNFIRNCHIELYDVVETTLNYIFSKEIGDWSVFNQYYNILYNNNELYLNIGNKIKSIWSTNGFGNFISIMLNNNVLKLEKRGVIFYLTYNDVDITNSLISNYYNNVSILIQNNKAIFYFYYNDVLKEKRLIKYNNNLESAITSITINGGDEGIKVDSVSVFKSDSEDIVKLYDDNPNFEPVWNSDNYQLYMTANFNGNLEGGTGTSTGSGFRVYRREYNSNVMFPIATIPSTTLQVKDFGLRSGYAYEYYLYVYDSNGSFMTNVEGNQRVAAKYNSYSLMVCDYDSDRDEYHVRKQYLFALNAAEGTMSNNNTPTINKNFTNYPTIMNSTSNYISGTLSSLIGVIYTVPALIEQIGTYKYIKKPSTLEYFDSVDLQKELFQLSTLPYQLFLRDKKGNMRMIKIISPISMTVNSKQAQLSTSISLQWAEIDNADDITVVQTPDDYGWDYDKEVLDVKLDVDTNSGLLSATYPRNYRGTTFNLVGANKEILQANTPIGITPANITLSNVATKTTDGDLIASVKVNKE